jgi:hypothetical protein
LGADPIYLLGFDCSIGKDGEKHYHSGYQHGSNPDAMNIFRRAFEAGAAMLEGRAKVVNLNPDSALRCFEFGNVDDVLAEAKAPTGQTITAITPTGDRPLAFRLCQEWMANQTRKPDQWVIVDDGKTPRAYDVDWFNAHVPGSVCVRREPRADDPQHTLDQNMRAALPHITGDKVLIIEDDEYYAPGYVAEMSRHLDTHEVVGIMDSKYYHLPTGGYTTCGNTRHASLAETGFRKSFLPTFERIVNEGSKPRWIDDRLWAHVKAGGVDHELFLDPHVPLYVGMKGLPGRSGIGVGHKESIYHRKDDAARTKLRAWIPGDFQVYLDVLEGMK